MFSVYTARTAKWKKYSWETFDQPYIRSLVPWDRLKLCLKDILSVMIIRSGAMPWAHAHTHAHAHAHAHTHALRSLKCVREGKFFSHAFLCNRVV